ncbi:DUF4339 domain-containing protein [Sorangium sp. So ce1024]|jgi:hypothetical protein|uniref:DUF4339 domain-containing protein n=1 Tax=unclassified Sorangium TaxID=2621164 RepID=UPI003F08E2EA
MRSVKLFAGLRSSERGFPDRWYVSNGEQSVGPVSLDQLARGIECGMVPLDSFVRNEAWTVWCPLSDIAMVTVAASETPEVQPDEEFAADDDDTVPLSGERTAPRPGAAAHPAARPGAAHR